MLHLQHEEKYQLCVQKDKAHKFSFFVTQWDPILTGPAGIDQASVTTDGNGNVQ